MAYMSQEKKAKLEPVIKAILKKYGVKGSLSVNNYSTLVLTLRSGKINFKDSYYLPKRYEDDDNSFHYQVNPYWYHEHFSGEARAFLTEVIDAMNAGNHNNSRSEIDYFDVGWYINVNIGKWNKPYKIIKEND